MRWKSGLSSRLLTCLGLESISGYGDLLLSRSSDCRPPEPEEEGRVEVEGRVGGEPEILCPGDVLGRGGGLT